MGRRSALGASLAAVGALVVLLLLIARKGPMAALVVILIVAVLIVILTVVTELLKMRGRGEGGAHGTDKHGDTEARR